MASETTPSRGISSRLLTMKFMQRAVASESRTDAESSGEPSFKRRKIDNSPLTGEFHSVDQESIQAALKSQEATRQAALEKHVAASADTHWVLDDPWSDTNNKDTESLPAIVYVGYADIDAPDDGRTARGQHGRTKIGSHKEKDGKKPKANSETVEPTSGGEESIAESGSPSSQTGKSGSGASGTGKERPRIPRSSKQTSEITQAREFRQKRIKKEVNLSHLTSISGAISNLSTNRFSQGKQKLVCHTCKQPGHMARECTRPGSKRKYPHQS